MILLKIRGVTKQFNTTVVLDNVSLDILEGEIFGIIGINGSGKTTLLKLIVGYYKPTKGSISYFDTDIQKLPLRAKRTIGFTTQDNSFYPRLTVEENIRYFASLYGLNNNEINHHTERVLALLDILEVRHMISEHLSGGMQRRLDMACSLVHDPKLLILDEPTEDLDPLLRRDILHLIKRINQLGTTVIITSHLLGDVEHLCDRVAILHDSKLLRVGTINEFKSLSTTPAELHLETIHKDYDALVRDLNLKTFFVENGRLVIYTDHPQELLEAILRILKNQRDSILYIDIKQPSLQELFEEMTDKKWL